METDDGDERIDAIIDAGTLRVGVAVSPQVSITIRHHAWATWATIAIEHERIAWETRTTAPADELRPALVAITAAAFALDALYGSSVERFGVPTPEVSCDESARWRRVAEAMRRGVSPASVAESWRDRIQELFDQRDDAVHFDEVDRPPVWHEPLHSKAAAEHGYWSLERATIAVDLVLDVLISWRDSPSKAAREWSEAYGDLVPSIVEQRRR